METSYQHLHSNGHSSIYLEDLLVPLNESHPSFSHTRLLR